MLVGRAFILCCWVYSHRFAGAKPPGGGLAEMCHVREKFDNESVCASDDTQSTKPKGRSIVVRCPVRSFYSPPHHHKWSTSGEKVPLAWHESDNSGKFHPFFDPPRCSDSYSNVSRNSLGPDSTST